MEDYQAIHAEIERLNKKLGLSGPFASFNTPIPPKPKLKIRNVLLWLVGGFLAFLFLASAFFARSIIGFILDLVLSGLSVVAIIKLRAGPNKEDMAAMAEFQKDVERRQKLIGTLPAPMSSEQRAHEASLDRIREYAKAAEEGRRAAREGS